MQEQMNLYPVRENIAEQNPAKDGGHHRDTLEFWNEGTTDKLPGAFIATYLALWVRGCSARLTPGSPALLLHFFLSSAAFIEMMCLVSFDLRYVGSRPEAKLTSTEFDSLRARNLSVPKPSFDGHLRDPDFRRNLLCGLR
jgi:hypothetical protein